MSADSSRRRDGVVEEEEEEEEEEAEEQEQEECELLIRSWDGSMEVVDVQVGE
jgi:hypothetical protein